jgi:Arc/MetJ-type ribon-helix-helix transcriptional regulator
MEITLSLPEALNSWVEHEASLAGYATAADYIRDVLQKHQQEQKRKYRDEIEAKLLEALGSGDPVHADSGADSGFWEARQQELHRRLERSRGTKGSDPTDHGSSTGIPELDDQAK